MGESKGICSTILGFVDGIGPGLGLETIGRVGIEWYDVKGVVTLVVDLAFWDGRLGMDWFCVEQAIAWKLSRADFLKRKGLGNADLCL